MNLFHTIIQHITEEKQTLTRIISQYSTKKGWRNPIKDGDYSNFLEAYKKGDLGSGDIIQIGKDQYLFLSMNEEGGHGVSHYAIAGLASPVFTHFPPKGGEIIYFNQKIFKWKKIDHITPEEWDKKVEELKQDKQQNL